MGCRKNLKNLTPTERSKFVNAFLELMDNGTAQQYAQMHAGAGSHGHGGPAFFPWHREYVRRFELELQTIDPDVSIPYWDWTEANLNSAGTESLIWRDDFLGGAGAPVASGPFAGRFNRGNFNIFSFPGTGGTINANMQSTNYNTFRQIEGPHGSAHVFIGGAVVSFATTAGTPDFWLIHCNVDRLWSEWINDHQGTVGFQPYLPLSGGPTGHSLNDTMWPWNGTTVPFGVPPWTTSPENVSPVDLLDHTSLGYTYDTVDGCRRTSTRPLFESLPVTSIRRENIASALIKESLPTKPIFENSPTQIFKETLPTVPFRENITTLALGEEGGAPPISNPFVESDPGTGVNRENVIDPRGGLINPFR